MIFKTISVVGLGYIGLPTAVAFASRKVKVIGVDVNQMIVDTINQGKIHIAEPDLDHAVRASVTEGYLRATTRPEPADAFLIAVPTPFKGDHKPDLSFIKAACVAISPVLKKGDLVILESTSPVGTTEQIASWLAENRPDLTFPQTHNEKSDVRVAYCPERVLPGHVMRELIENDRVIGGLTDKCSQISVELYKIFVVGECYVTSARMAEMAKLTENSFRDVNIAFANELSMICDKLNLNVWELIKLANRHPRVNVLQPGPGVGGHCVAVDPWFIVSSAPRETRLIHAARLVNDSKPIWLIEKIRNSVDELLHENKHRKSEDISIGCYGLTFKPDIDDLRGSPALEIVTTIASTHRGNIYVNEPNIHELPEQLQIFENVSLVEQDAVIRDIDIVLGLVAHSDFKKITLADFANIKVIDAMGMWK